MRTLQRVVTFFCLAATACGSAPSAGERAPLGPPPPASKKAEGAPKERPHDEKTTEPGTSPPPPLTAQERSAHIDDALHELEEAERALRRSFDQKTTPSAPSETSPRPPTASAPDCGSACAALRSMTRSAGYVCRLAGDADARCGRAKERVANAEKRVVAAGCSCPEPTTRSFEKPDAGVGGSAGGRPFPDEALPRVRSNHCASVRRPSARAGHGG